MKKKKNKYQHIRWNSVGSQHCISTEYFWTGWLALPLSIFCAYFGRQVDILVPLALRPFSLLYNFRLFGLHIFQPSDIEVWVNAYSLGVCRCNYYFTCVNVDFVGSMLHVIRRHLFPLVMLNCAGMQLDMLLKNRRNWICQLECQWQQQSQ